MPRLKEIRTIGEKVQIVMFGADPSKCFEFIDLDLGQAKFWHDHFGVAIKDLEDITTLRRAREATELRQKQQQKKQELLAIAEKLRALGVPDDEPDPEPVVVDSFYSRGLTSVIFEVGAQ